MAGYILKYSAGTYQRKISALEGYYSQLVTHLEQLNTLQGQMKDFWDGSASSTEYMKPYTISPAMLAAAPAASVAALEASFTSDTILSTVEPAFVRSSTTC